MLGRQLPAGAAAPAWLEGCDLLVQPVAAAGKPTPCALPSTSAADSADDSADEDGSESQHIGAAQAGAVAASAAAKHLVLTGASGLGTHCGHPGDFCHMTGAGHGLSAARHE